MLGVSMAGISRLAIGHFAKYISLSVQAILVGFGLPYIACTFLINTLHRLYNTNVKTNMRIIFIFQALFCTYCESFVNAAVVAKYLPPLCRNQRVSSASKPSGLDTVRFQCG